MGFLTIAEIVMAADSPNAAGPVADFKVLVISDSDVFLVLTDVSEYFSNASVEVNALDLSRGGNLKLKESCFHT